MSIRREDFGEVARLLGIPDGVNSYMDNLEKPDDPRKFMIFYNPLYSRLKAEI